MIIDNMNDFLIKIIKKENEEKIKMITKALSNSNIDAKYICYLDNKYSYYFEGIYKYNLFSFFDSTANDICEDKNKCIKYINKLLLIDRILKENKDILIRYTIEEKRNMMLCYRCDNKKIKCSNKNKLYLLLCQIRKHELSMDEYNKIIINKKEEDIMDLLNNDVNKVKDLIKNTLN